MPKNTQTTKDIKKCPKIPKTLDMKMPITKDLKMSKTLKNSKTSKVLKAKR